MKDCTLFAVFVELILFCVFSVKNVTSTLIALVENDHLDDWSPEKDCC